VCVIEGNSKRSDWRKTSRSHETGYVAVWPSFERCGRDAEFLKAPCLFGSDAIDSGPFAFSPERFANNSASDRSPRYSHREAEIGVRNRGADWPTRQLTKLPPRPKGRELGEAEYNHEVVFLRAGGYKTHKVNLPP
jgi:hypothetical protein